MTQKNEKQIDVMSGEKEEKNRSEVILAKDSQPDPETYDFEDSLTPSFDSLHPLKPIRFGKKLIEDYEKEIQKVGNSSKITPQSENLSSHQSIKESDYVESLSEPTQIVDAIQENQTD